MIVVLEKLKSFDESLDERIRVGWQQMFEKLRSKAYFWDKTVIVENKVKLSWSQINGFYAERMLTTNSDKMVQGDDGKFI